MSRKWSEESRKRQKKSIRTHKPWEVSTGPKSEAGKQRSSRNADKGKTPIRLMQKMIRKVHKERLEILRWLEHEYGIKIHL